MKKEKIIIIDFGSQYSQLIARRVREANVYSEIVPCNISSNEILKISPKGIILSGGPSSVYEPNAPTIEKQIFNLKIPILGICYGLQLMTHLLGGKVEKSDKGEFGKTELFVTQPQSLFKGLNENLICWMSHKDKVVKMPAGFTKLAHTNSTPFAAIANVKNKHFGVQFHPEVFHTPWGIDLIKNFLFEICKCSADWNIGTYINEVVKEIAEKVKNNKVLCALSGGVDSSATAVIVHKAIKDRLTCIFVNHGLLREGEDTQVVKTFRENFKIKLVYVDASKRFLEKLKGVTDPEAKRKIIGKEFIRIFEEEANKLGKFPFLAQGTLYPDVIESMSPFKGPSAKIKTHHNVGGLPTDIKFQLIEPLRFLFKDEVRKLCEELKIPPEITWRQPFPGPGLAIRIIGEVTKERIETLRKADAIILQEINNYQLTHNIWQAFAVLLPVKSVGVMGDVRTYAHPCVVRIVSSEDGMTADWAKIPYELLEKISNRIVNEVEEINRVVYDITSKPPATIEWE